MTATSQTVEMLHAEDAPQAVEVLCEAFYEYPVMRYVLGTPEDYPRRLETLVTFFVMARVHKGEVLQGIRNGDRLDGAAAFSFPGRRASTEALANLREKTWDELGSEARYRYEAFGRATEEFDLEAPHVHLNMIGVRNDAQGMGLGGKLLAVVHAISEADELSVGVTLSTEHEANLPLYLHAGYEIVGSATVAPELTTWVFFRANQTE